MRIKPLAFALRDRYAVDPARGISLPPHLFDDDALDAALDDALSGQPSARAPRPAPCAGGDTTTLVVMDRRGNAASWVQSLFADFGSGVVSPATGIVMHNRLSLERLDDDPSRGLRAGMRPFHTLCPALLVGDEGCELAIATPGDHAQPQTLFQVLLQVFEAHKDIQSAIEAPRMRHDDETGLMLETALFARYALSLPGLRLVDGGERTRRTGGVNAIQRAGNNVLMSGADPRRACYAVCA
jgi:gamma-glutamyltranspeptidase/glutathione hydrolase